MHLKEKKGYEKITQKFLLEGETFLKQKTGLLF